MTETSKEIGRKSGKKNRLYGQRNYKCMISTFHYYMQAYKYVYRNPVEAGLVHTSESYEYSTLKGLVGKKKLGIPLEEDTLMDNVDQNLKWLNTPVEKYNWETVGKALKKSEFKLAKNPNTQMDSELESRLL